MITSVKKGRSHDVLVADIRRQIDEGLLQPGQYVLAERALAGKYGISARAVRVGLNCLETEGLIGRHQGRGTIVRQQTHKSTSPALDNVAVIYQGRISDPSTAEEFDHLQQSLQQEGFGTTLYVADYSPEKESRIVEQLVATRVPGLVLFSAHPSNSFDHLKKALAAGMKVVLFDHAFSKLDCNFVGIDDCLAACEATEHLIRLGCRELLFINSEFDRTTHTLRQRGFEEAAIKSGLPYRVLRVPHQDWPPILRQELAKLPRSIQRPLGVMAWWDLPAVHAIEYLVEAGWSVPKEAKVVGIANDLCGEAADIPLTTMAIPRQEIARLMASILVNQIRNPDRPPQQIRFPARMIIRASCGNYDRQDQSGVLLNDTRVKEAIMR